MQVALVVKNLPAKAGDVDSLPGLGSPLEKGMATPVFWPGEFHGQRSLVGYSPWSRKDLDTIESLSTHSICHFNCSIQRH